MKSQSSTTKISAPRVVRLAQSFGLCQLFRPLSKDSSERPTLNESFNYRELNLRFSAREALGAPEQTLLLVLLELAQEQYLRRPTEHTLDKTGRSEVGTLLWSSLHIGLSNVLADAPATLMLNCTWSELHRRCGSASFGGAVTGSRRKSLCRLCEVTVWESVESTRTVRSCRLVSWLVADDQRVHVALNHGLAAALLSPGYAQILLSERLQLPSQTAMLVHAFLSTCLGVGKSMNIGYEKLVERLWPLKEKAIPASTQRRRISDVKSALRAIAGLERWKVQMGPLVAHLTRTQPKSTAMNLTESAQTKPLITSKPVESVCEMTKHSHFAIPDSSYSERPFWPVVSSYAPLP